VLISGYTGSPLGTADTFQSDVSSFLVPDFVVTSSEVHPNSCGKERYPLSKAKTDQYCMITGNWCKIEGKLISFTNRKSNNGSWLVPLTLQWPSLFYQIW